MIVIVKKVVILKYRGGNIMDVLVIAMVKVRVLEERYIPHFFSLTHNCHLTNPFEVNKFMNHESFQVVILNLVLSSQGFP
jgi:hypothetical protein